MERREKFGLQIGLTQKSIFHFCNLKIEEIFDIRIMCYLLIFLCPFLAGFYALMGIICQPKKWKQYIPFHVLFIFMTGYTYSPLPEMDLTRYFNMVYEISKSKTLNEILKYDNDGMIVKNIIFWLIGRSGDVHLLPALSTAIVYGIAGYITCDFASSYGAKRLIPPFFLLQYVLLPLISVISNVRNICAFSLFVLAVYLDVIKRKRTISVGLLYIIPCFIHPSAVVLIVLRLLVLAGRRLRIFALLALPFFPLAINEAHKYIYFFSNKGTIGIAIQTGIKKAYSYIRRSNLTEYEIELLKSEYAFVQRIFMMSFAILILIAIFYYSKYGDKSKYRDKFNSFIYFICIMTLACNVFIAAHYWRFYCVIVIACPLILIPFIREGKRAKNTMRFLYCCILLFGIGGVAMNARNLAISSDMLDWFYNLFLTNPFNILYQFFSYIG